jgi:dTDP-glucose pyrophosphorylase
MIENIQRHIISRDKSIIYALQRLNDLSGKSMTLMVVDNDMTLLGTLTDGDIRRAILAGAELDWQVDRIMFTGFRHVGTQTPDVEYLKECRRHKITLLPRLDENGKLVGILDLEKTSTVLPIAAILIAGGKGERLRPMTLTTPKPLLTIDGKAIIDYNVEALARCGITDITVTTGYLAEQIHRHFDAPVAGVKVKCVTEDHPTGTIGSTALVPHTPGGATLVMNSDLLTTISFEEMYLHHRRHDADITIAVIPYQVAVPFAILSTDDDRVTALEEKPTYSYFANAGIYIINNDILDTVSPEGRTDATDLIESSIADGKKVVYYTVDGTWIDVGSPADFKQATELMRHYRQLSGRD